MCEQQYFIEYVLGIRSPSNKKADKGTIVHKVLEILACIKQGEQNSEIAINDDVIGNITLKKYSLDNIIKKVYSYYTSQFTHHVWEDKDYQDCYAWVYKAINYNNGMFDPRNRQIVCPEQHFDIPINFDWAKFNYKTKDGDLNGKLAIKGTIDLITRVDDKTLEIVDWKTGRRLDWATGQEKTHEKLQNDPQLKMYHYAVQQLYPEIEHIIVSIFFINDGGAFSICYNRSDLTSTELMLKNKFEIIKNSQIPKLNKTWKCNKLCHFGKTTFENTHVHPLPEYRDGQLCQKDTVMTKCEQIKHDIAVKGVNAVVDEYTSPGYTISKYKAPGSTE
jgi:CRISPR/Cas system-associated exonuclease Cas4 (RecB family)